LHYNQPPHFMMLSEVAQTRTFAATAAFSWTNLWNRLFIAKGGTSTITNKGTNIWQAGPFAAGATESPTIKFNPLQGQDFAQRFESSLTDKFTLFLEDLRWYGTLDERKELVLLFVQSLDLEHGDDATNGGQCGRGLYFNRRFKEQDLDTAPNEPHHYSGDLSECVRAILKSHPNYVADRRQPSSSDKYGRRTKGRGCSLSVAGEPQNGPQRARSLYWQTQSKFRPGLTITPDLCRRNLKNNRLTLSRRYGGLNGTSRIGIV
jgi:hypothetical protein